MPFSHGVVKGFLLGRNYAGQPEEGPTRLVLGSYSVL